MNVTISTAATVRPVSVTEAKEHLQIEHDADNPYIDTLVRAATAQVEAYTGRALINRTITLELDANEAFSPITLPYAPYQSLTSFSYYDSDGNETAVSSSVYYVAGGDPAKIVANSSGWQIYRRYKSHKIVYVAGYGAAPSSVEYDLRHAVKMLVGEMWRNQDAGGYMPAGVAEVLSPYRLLV